MDKPRGRPPLHRNRSSYIPRVELALYQELQDRAAAMQIPLSRYVDAVMAEAFDFDTPYLPRLEGYMAVSGDELRRFRREVMVVEDGPTRRGPNRRLDVNADEPLAQKIEEQCTELGMPYTYFTRALLRVAVGHPVTGVDSPVQAELELQGAAS